VGLKTVASPRGLSRDFNATGGGGQAERQEKVRRDTAFTKAMPTVGSRR